MKSFVCCIVLLTLFCGTEGCSIHKRTFRPGWYISTNWSKSNHTTRDHKTESNKEHSLDIDTKYDPTESVTKAEAFTLGKEEVDNDFSGPNPDFSKNRKIAPPFHELSDNTQYPEESRASKPIELMDNKSSNELNEEEKSNFWPKFTGGLLGVLLALIALGPIFLFSFVFNSGELEDEIFQSSSDDSTFATAFKNAFNAVLKFGFVVLWIAVFLLFFAALFYLGYVVAGIIGGIIAILLFVGIVLLLAYLLGNLIDFIVPDY